MLLTELLKDTVALKPRVLPCRGDLERLLGTRDWRKACHFQPRKSRQVLTYCLGTTNTCVSIDPNGNATYTYRCAECEKAGRICRPVSYPHPSPAPPPTRAVLESFIYLPRTQLHPSSIRAVVDFVLATEAIRSTDLNEATHETKVALMNSLDAAEDDLKRSVALAPNAPRPNTSEWVDHWRIQRDAEATLRTKLRDFNA